MVILGTHIRERLGQLGLSPDALDARLGELSSPRLATLARLGGLSSAGALEADPLRGQRFGAAPRDARVDLPPAFSNPTPAAARAALAPLVGSTYAPPAGEAGPSAPAGAEWLPHVLHPRRGRAAIMTLALSRRPELRERVGSTLGALIGPSPRADGVLTVERAPRASSGARGPRLPPPGSASGTGTMWDIMMSMDRAILLEAARLGLGQGSGAPSSGTADRPEGAWLEALGLWSLTPDEGDPSDWLGFGRSANRAVSSGSSSMTGGMTGVPQPTDRSAAPGSPTGTAGPEADNESLDVATMRLKRMIDKKTQMMELYSQTLSKYNTSANTIISNMKG